MRRTSRRAAPAYPSRCGSSRPRARRTRDSEARSRRARRRSSRRSSSAARNVRLSASTAPRRRPARDPARPPSRTPCPRRRARAPTSDRRGTPRRAGRHGERPGRDIRDLGPERHDRCARGADRRIRARAPQPEARQGRARPSSRSWQRDDPKPARRRVVGRARRAHGGRELERQEAMRSGRALGRGVLFRELEVNDVRAGRHRPASSVTAIPRRDVSTGALRVAPVIASTSLPFDEASQATACLSRLFPTRRACARRRPTRSNPNRADVLGRELASIRIVVTSTRAHAPDGTAPPSPAVSVPGVSLPAPVARSSPPLAFFSPGLASPGVVPVRCVRARRIPDPTCRAPPRRAAR